jgi:GNAT superfamily N-acetyltransferase
MAANVAAGAFTHVFPIPKERAITIAWGVHGRPGRGPLAMEIDMYLPPPRPRPATATRDALDDLIRRFLALADEQAHAIGLHLRLSTDFARLIALNRRHRDSWPPLTPIFDPAHSRLDPDTAFFVEGVDDLGETVVTHAARLFRWPQSTLADEARALRVFYADPAPHRAAGEAVTIAAPSAARIRGRTAGLGALWVRPDFRRHGPSTLVPRVLRAQVLARWNAAFTWSFMEPHIHTRGFAQRSGPLEAEDGVMLHLAFRGDLPAKLVWMSRAASLADIAAAVAQPTAEMLRGMERLSRYVSVPSPRIGTSSRS